MVINVSGTSKDILEIFVRVGGEAKRITDGWVNVGGVAKRIYSALGGVVNWRVTSSRTSSSTTRYTTRSDSGTGSESTSASAARSDAQSDADLALASLRASPPTGYSYVSGSASASAPTVVRTDSTTETTTRRVNRSGQDDTKSGAESFVQSLVDRELSNLQRNPPAGYTYVSGRTHVGTANYVNASVGWRTSGYAEATYSRNVLTNVYQSSWSASARFSRVVTSYTTRYTAQWSPPTEGTFTHFRIEEEDRDDVVLASTARSRSYGTRNPQARIRAEAQDDDNNVLYAGPWSAYNR